MNRFEAKVAFRYLRSSPLQTTLILLGVGVGIVVYTFIASLINGLAVRLTDDVAGNIAHVRLEPPDRIPRAIGGDEDLLLAVQESNERRSSIGGWRQFSTSLAEIPNVAVVAPQALGSGFIRRGEKIAPILVTGVESGQLSAVADVAGNLVRGEASLTPSDVIVGTDLADELGVTTGQRLVVESERGRERALTIRGIFDLGASAVNERTVYVELGTAQALLDLEGDVTQIALKLGDVNDAATAADRAGGMTGLKATTWIEENARLQEALASQAMTGNLIKLFSIVTIVIGVSSVLLVASVRRRPEIGIMRSMGVSKRSVIGIFVLQGLFIGAIGSTLGALVGWGFTTLLDAVTSGPDGVPTLPIDPAQGEYLVACLLATIASTVAAYLPARSAAAIDPVEVIQQ